MCIKKTNKQQQKHLKENKPKCQQWLPLEIGRWDIIASTFPVFTSHVL